MNSLILSAISQIVGGTLKGNKNLSIDTLSTDSRTLLNATNTLFFALKTAQSDGHKYVEAAYKKGVRAFVVQHEMNELAEPNDASFLLVSNALDALQKLATFKRNSFNGKTIGITGSNGKTIVKEWIHELLSPNMATTRSPKSYNSQIGVPLSVWLASENDEVAIWEAGISQPGEMVKLAPIIQPQIGIFTNIGEAHQANFTSTKQKVEEKMHLFQQAQVLVFCRDHAEIREAAEALASQNNMECFDWSTSESSARLFIETVEITPDGTGILARTEDKQYALSIPFSDAASIENACQCLALLSYLKHDGEEVLNRFSTLQPIAMRLEIKEATHNCLLINDSYNADINSLRIALTTLNQQASKGHLSRTLVLSDIQQSGEMPDVLYKHVAELVQQSEIDRFIAIGTQIGSHRELFGVQAQFFASTDEFLSQLPRLGFSNEAILLKGARAFQFDQIASALQSKVHETVLEIDMSAMVHNLNYFRHKLNASTKIMVMVKAFSYGSGTAEIARLLEFHRADYLAVAIADEGVALRKAGISMPIVVMNPEEHSFDLMIENRLEPNIYSHSVFTKFLQAAKRSAVHDFPIHIKTDTGMKRLGFEHCWEVEQLAQQVRSGNELHIQSVFSHLAGSDEETHDAFTLQQIERFQTLSDALIAAYGRPVDRHILNSAGIERFSQFQFEMARLGIGLYGISTINNNNLQNVSTLKTTISQIKSIQPGETVGYGRKGVAERETRIAILPIGYADGLNRRLSNGIGCVNVNGQNAPIFGNICMDMCMVDISKCQAQEGDRVVVFGKELSPLVMANALETIPYEVFTSVSQRVKRVYFQE
jgi:Alr-MurF fusion protein